MQGKVVNENQNRIFLKTDQGTIKIIPSDILGREDTGKKGDLTYFSDRLEYLNSNVQILSSRLNHLKDSLSFSLKDLYDLFQNIDAIQNEYEIELLRLQSKLRQHDQNLEYNNDDLTNNRVRIAEHNQKITGLSDTLQTLDNLVKKINNKINVNNDKLYLLSGNLATTKKDIQDLNMRHENSQNQIDMMSGALANNIQEVIRVQGQFSDVESGIKQNSDSIKDINRALIIQKEDLVLHINSRYNTIDSQLQKIKEDINKINVKIISVDDKGQAERKIISQNLMDLKGELDILNEKVLSFNRENQLTAEKLNLLGDNIDAINKQLIRMESSSKKINNQMLELQLKLDANADAKDEK